MMRFLVVSVLAAASLAAADHPVPELLGLWEVVSIRDVTAGKDLPVHREHHVFTAGHEMIILAAAGRPKLKKSLSEMSADEVMSQQPVGAGFYEYRVEGDTLVRVAQVTLSAFYEGREVTTHFEIQGDTLITRDSHSADGHVREWTMRRVE